MGNNMTPATIPGLEKIYRLQRILTESKNLPQEILAYFAECEDTELRLGVAMNPHCPAELLNNLARDEDDEVAWTVAENPNTRVETLEFLANHCNSDVRASVLNRPRVPDEVLLTLADDIDDHLRKEVRDELKRRGHWENVKQYFEDDGGEGDE